MRTYGLVTIGLLCLVSLAGCGNEDEIAAKVREWKQLRNQYKALNREKVEKHPERLAIRNAVMPAKSALIGAKRSEDKAAIEQAQAALNEAENKANAVIEAEAALAGRIRDLRDEIAAAEKSIRKLGGRVPKKSKK